MNAKILAEKITRAEREAWNALARYKGSQFGYWFGIWVHLNEIEGKRRPNPWRALVHAAREHLGRDPHRPTTTARRRTEQLSLSSTVRSK